MFGRSILKTIVFILVCIGSEVTLGGHHIKYDQKFELALVCAITTAYIDKLTAMDQGRDSPYTEVSLYYLGLLKYAGGDALDYWKEGVRRIAADIESNEETLDGLRKSYEMCVTIRERGLSLPQSH